MSDHRNDVVLDERAALAQFAAEVYDELAELEKPSAAGSSLTALAWIEQAVACSREGRIAGASCAIKRAAGHLFREWAMLRQAELEDAAECAEVRELPAGLEERRREALAVSQEFIARTDGAA